MKFYSETLHRMFDTENDLHAAEAEQKAKDENERIERERTEKVKENRRSICSAALEASRKARKDYECVSAQFLKDYGHSWMTTGPVETDYILPTDKLTSMLDMFFNSVNNSFDEVKK